jgi:hypothetical protein
MQSKAVKTRFCIELPPIRRQIVAQNRENAKHTNGTV